MSDTTTEPITLQAYNPGDLLMDANARTNAEATVTKADVALCTTIAASRPDGCGNNVPITIVRRPDGRLRVRAGHRRNIGCLRAGVPVLGFVAGAEGDERADRRARLIEQWNENHHRVPMTVRDDTAVLLALFDEEEMTEAAIAKATGLARPQVAASLAVARSQVATSAAERWDFLTLDQAAALAEFEDDQEALTALVQAAKGSPSQFDHVAAQLRATRAEREAKAAFTAGLQAQGIAIYGERPYVPWTLALENLRDGDGNHISPQAHATCPGRAVTITYEWDWAPGAEAAYRAAHDLAGDDDLAGVEFGTDEEAREAGFVPGWQVGHYLCTDPGQYGHANVHGTPGEHADPRAAGRRRPGRRGRPPDRTTPPGPAAEHRMAGRDRHPHLPPQGGTGPQGPASGRAQADRRGDGPGRDAAAGILVRPPDRLRTARPGRQRRGHRAPGPAAGRTGPRIRQTSPGDRPGDGARRRRARRPRRARLASRRRPLPAPLRHPARGPVPGLAGRAHRLLAI